MGLANGWFRLPVAQGPRFEYAQKVLQAFYETYRWSNPSFVVPTLTLVLAAILFLARKPIWILLFATAVELLFFAIRWNPTVKREMLYPQTPAIEFLQQRAGIERVLSLGAYWPNTLTPYQIHSVCGYEGAFFPKVSADYIAALIPPDSRHPHFPHFVMALGRRYEPHLLNLMGVRYIVVPKADSVDGLPKVHESAVRIYENPHRMPRAFLLTDSPSIDLLKRGTVEPHEAAQLPAKVRGKAEIVHYGYNEVVIKTHCDEAGWLVFTDAFAAGWHATVDGKSLPVSRALVMFRAVPVPEGDHEVVFSYEPPMIRYGLSLALFALLIVIGLAVKGGSTAVEQRDDGQSPGGQV
jgi:hypothetical protein